MTEEERLRNAGWSPGSLRLAMGVLDSPVAIDKVGQSTGDMTNKSNRFALKRSPNDYVGTPQSSTHRDSKLLSLKTTPNFRIGGGQTIDLSVSTVKKQMAVQSSAILPDYDDDDYDDGIMILTQTFRRQSIEPIKTEKNMDVKHSKQQYIPIHQDTKAEVLNHFADKTKRNINSKLFSFEIASPTSGKDNFMSRTSNRENDINSGNLDSGRKWAIETSPMKTCCTSSADDFHVIDTAKKAEGSQMSKLLEVAGLENTLPNGWKLFKHQKDAVTECLKLGRTIMAFDMGLGKTIISLIWAKAVCSLCPDCIALIIVPCTLTEVWKREAEMIGFTTTDIYRKTSYKSKNNALGPANKLRISIHSWSKIPSACEFEEKFVLIADEAHAMQSITSIRTKNALGLCLHRNCLGVVLSTGTPMKNGRPSNILPLLIAIRHPVARDKIEFEKKYCNAKKTKFCAWDVSGASNLHELKTSIGPYLMRKTKEECLDLPPLTRSTVKIEISEDDLTEYNNIISTMKKKMKSNYSKQNAGNGHGGNSSCLEMMSQLRIFSSRSKVPGTASLIRERLEECSDPIVVFVWFKESSSLLQSALQEDRLIRCECLTGEIVKHQLRQEMVDRFQKGEIDVLICTFGVGSTGLTLTRSHTVVLLDRPWTPGDAAQAEDRVRRIGQLSNKVESIWIEAFELDKKLDSMLKIKAKNTAKVLSSKIEQEKSKDPILQKGKIMKANAPHKTLNDFFASQNSPSRKTSRSLDFVDDHIPENVAENGVDFGADDEEENEKSGASIMQSVFRHVMKS